MFYLWYASFQKRYDIRKKASLLTNFYALPKRRDFKTILVEFKSFLVQMSWLIIQSLILLQDSRLAFI